MTFTMLLQFFQAPITSAQAQDDLLFFVYLEAYQVSCITHSQSHITFPSTANGHAGEHSPAVGADHLLVMQADTPYFVRRKSKVLPAELQMAGEKAHQVDWKRSILLNLVTQTTYSLTVSACTRDHLQSAGGSQASSSDAVQVALPIDLPQADNNA